MPSQLPVSVPVSRYFPSILLANSPFQLIVLVLTLGTTGMVLDRYRLWESYEPRGTVNLTEEAQYAAEVILSYQV